MGSLKMLIFLGCLAWFSQFCIRTGYNLNHNSHPLLKQFVLEQLLKETPKENTATSPLDAIKPFFN